MALKPCKECKKEISHTAPTCPHCGVKNPGVSKSMGVFGWFVTVLVLIAVIKSCSSDDGQKETAKSEPKISDAECLKDLSCIGNKGTITAGVKCPRQIESLAKADVKWTDGTFEPKFSRFRWKDEKESIVTHIGDKAQFQNGFGAYINVIYTCDLDMKQGQGEVVGVDVFEGRF